MRPLPVTALVLLVAGCASAAAVPDDVAQRSLPVTIPGSRTDAVARTASVLVESGFVVRESSAVGGVVVTAPFRHDPATEMVVTANVIGAGTDSTRVVLSATYTIPSLRIRDEPASSRGGGVRGEVWRRLERLAAAVRAAR